jgi:hypothetical protein
MTYPQPPQPVERQIHGMLSGVEARQNGWMAFLVLEDGMQYPTKVSTKLPELVQQAMALLNQQVSVQMREQESTTINPNSGRPYINRYLQQIAPRGTTPETTPASVQPAQTTAPMPQMPAIKPGLAGFDKDLNIMRQCASKIAAVMLPTLPPEQQNVHGMVAVAEAWMAYYVYGPARFGMEPFTNPNGQQAPDNWGGYQGPGPDPMPETVPAEAGGPSEDIPFAPTIYNSDV